MLLVALRLPQLLKAICIKMSQTIAGLALLFEVIHGGYDAVRMVATARALE